MIEWIAAGFVCAAWVCAVTAIVHLRRRNERLRHDLKLLVDQLRRTRQSLWVAETRLRAGKGRGSSSGLA